MGHPTEGGAGTFLMLSEGGAIAFFMAFQGGANTFLMVAKLDFCGGASRRNDNRPTVY